MRWMEKVAMMAISFHGMAATSSARWKKATTAQERLLQEVKVWPRHVPKAVAMECRTLMRNVMMLRQVTLCGAQSAASCPRQSVGISAEVTARSATMATLFLEMGAVAVAPWKLAGLVLKGPLTLILEQLQAICALQFVVMALW